MTIHVRTMDTTDANLVAVDFESEAFAGDVGYTGVAEELLGFDDAMVFVMIAENGKTGPLR